MNQIKNPLSERGEMTAMEPPMGIEPTTYALRVHCSTNWARMASSRIIEKNHFSARKIQKNCYFLFVVSLYDKVWEYDRTSEREFLSVIASYVSCQQRANSLNRSLVTRVVPYSTRSFEILKHVKDDTVQKCSYDFTLQSRGWAMSPYCSCPDERTERKMRFIFLLHRW